MNLSIPLKQRSEESEALKMIEVQMGKENMYGVDRLVGHLDSEGPNASTCIQNQYFSLRAPDLHAGRVAPIPQSVRSGGSDRSATSPHTSFHCASQKTVRTPCISPARANNG